MKFKNTHSTNNILYHGYHGSRKAFDKFEYSFIGSHGLENGFGLYFTNDEFVAKSYGNYIIEADLIATKEIDDYLLNLDIKIISKEIYI